MSRLIREEDALKVIRNGWSNHCSCKEMCEEINDIPTAYDIDKVVEQLERRAYETADWMCGGTMKAVELTDAIKIVKGGAE